MSVFPSLAKKKKQAPIGTISPTERQDKKVFDRSLLEEVLGKMERTGATVQEDVTVDGKSKSVTRPMSRSQNLAKDIMLAITPSLGLGKKAPLIKENIFGLQDLAILAALDELYNGPDDESTKGMNLVLENVTLSMYPRAVTEELRNVNIIQKEDPETKLFMKFLMSRELGMQNIAAGLERKTAEEET